MRPLHDRPLLAPLPPGEQWKQDRLEEIKKMDSAKMRHASIFSNLDQQSKEDLGKSTPKLFDFRFRKTKYS